MPYIKLIDRPRFDTIIEGLLKRATGFTIETTREVVANILIVGLTDKCLPYSIDPATDDIVRTLASRIRVRGDANYIACRFVLESMKPATGWSYHSLSDAIKILDTCPQLISDAFEVIEEAMYDCISVCLDAAHEIRRRLLDPYEDTAIRKNGDMICFNEPFAYIPPIDFTFDELAGGCCGYCRPPVAEACCDEPLDLNMSDLVNFPPVTEAFTQEQIDATERAARKTG